MGRGQFDAGVNGLRDHVGDGSVTSPAGPMSLRENVECYLTGLTSSVIPGQPFEDKRVKPETGKYPVDSQAICKFCDGTHELENCFKFRDKCYAQRKDFVRKQNLCENCLNLTTLQGVAEVLVPVY